MISAEQPVPRTDLALPRFLAVILFGLAASMGLPLAAGVVVSLFAGTWAAALLMTSVLPIVWATARLGRVIWSGRSIPIWFVFTLCGLMSAVPAAALLVKREWLGALGTLALLLPFFAVIWSGMRTTYGKPAKPKGLDDELA